MLFLNILKKYQQKLHNKEFLSRVTILGNKYKIFRNNKVSLLWGSTKEDIILHDDVTFLGASLTTSHHGKIVFKAHSKIDINCYIQCVDRVEIGEFTAIAKNVYITDNNSHPINPEFRRYMRTTPSGSDARAWIHAEHAPVIIGNNCWIGQNVRIQKGVTIGDNSVIGACSVVTRSIPANCVAVGVPAKVVKTDIDQLPLPTSCEEFNEYLRKKEMKNED